MPSRIDTRTLVNLLLLTFCLLLAHVPTVQATPLVAADPDQHTLYAMDDQFGGGRILGLWHLEPSGEHFESLAPPFGPFRYHMPGLPRDLQTSILFNVHGQSGVLVDGRVFYHRDGDLWQAEDLVAAAGNPLHCKKTTRNSLCHVVLTAPDGRGGRFIYQSEGADQSVILVQDAGGDLRPTRGAETRLTLTDLIFGTFLHVPFLWSPDGRSLMFPLSLANQKTPGEGLKFDILAPDGRRSVALALPGRAHEAIATAQFYQAGTQYYTTVILQPTVDPRQPQPALSHGVAFRIDDFFGAQPAISQVADLGPNSSVASVFAPAAEGHFSYYTRYADLQTQDVRLLALDLTTGASRDLGSCPQGGRGGVVLTRPGSATASLWLACDRQVRELVDGQVKTAFTTTEPVAAGTLALGEDNTWRPLLAVDSGDIIRQTAAGALQRLSAAAPGMTATPALKPAWDEGGRICGVATSAAAEGRDAPTQILCQNGLAWLPTDLSLPPPITVFHSSTALWALTPVPEGLAAYRRDLRTANAGWQPVQTWPGHGAAAASAYWLPNGPHAVALDLGGEAIWVWNGTQFVEQYKHKRVYKNFHLAIGDDGTLYDFCFPDSAPPAAAAADATARVCAITADGQSTPLALPQAADSNASLFALRRGVLYMGGKNAYVFRDHRAIDLGALYGELSTRPDGRFPLRAVDTGDGTVLVHKSDTARAYRYDGLALSDLGAMQNLAERPDPGLERRPLQQIWQDPDGLWRTLNSAVGSPFAVSRDVATAVGATPPASANVVSGAAWFGGQLWLSNDQGLWLCDPAGGTALERTLASLPLHHACRYRRPLPMARILATRGQQILVQQGNKLLELTPGESADGQSDLVRQLYSGPMQAAATTPSTATATGDAQLTWTADDAYYELDLERAAAPGAAPSPLAALPAGVTTADVRATAPGWLCTKQGAYHLRADGSWDAPLSGAGCLALAVLPATAAPDAPTATPPPTALVLGDTQAWVCAAGGACTEVLLPKPALADSVVGTLADGTLGLLFGATLYRYADGACTDITPVYAEGSALITRATSLSHGILSLNGGGVVYAAPSPLLPGWRHLRLE